MIPLKEKSVRIALKKTRGMLDKIEAMLNEDRYCADIAQQVNAAIGLLKNVNREILVSHLHTCGAHRLGSKVETERQEFIDELLHIANITKRA